MFIFVQQALSFFAEKPTQCRFSTFFVPNLKGTFEGSENYQKLRTLLYWQT